MSLFKDFDSTFDGVWRMHFKRSQQDSICINIKLCGVWKIIVKYLVSQHLCKLKVVLTFLSFYTKKFPRPPYAQNYVNSTNKLSYIQLFLFSRESTGNQSSKFLQKTFHLCEISPLLIIYILFMPYKNTYWLFL